MSESSPVPSRRDVVVMVSTRKLDGESMAGRLRVAHAIRAVLSASSDLTVLRLPNVLTDRSLPRLIGASLGWLQSLLMGELLPLQCALFANRADHRRLVAQLPKNITALYLDGVRSYSLLVYLRQKFPDLRIVVDLDDLMSRRMALLLEAGEPLSPGYLTKRLPEFLQRFTMSKGVGNLIVRYEQRTLVHIEQRLANLADALVLLSSEDARILTVLCKENGRAEIAVIPPCSEPVAPPQTLKPPVRFVFIGSDALTQNRLTIDYLTDLWRRKRFEAQLVLYGLRSRADPLPPSVTAAGYVESLAEVYDGQSVLITPSLIGGGVKTKVLEAFAHGAPVIGNALTFESMALDGYPLNISDEAGLVDLISRPQDHLTLFVEASRAGSDYLRTFHSPAAFAERWRQMMLARPAGQASANMPESSS